jgi:hypothetical protein
VAIQRVQATQTPGSPVIPPAAARPDRTQPRIRLLSPRRQSLRRFRNEGLRFRIGVDEAVTLRVTVYARFTRRVRRASGSVAEAAARGKVRQLRRVRMDVDRAGVVTVRIRPRSAFRLMLRRESVLPATLSVRATDRAGNVSTRTKLLLFK